LVCQQPMPLFCLGNARIAVNRLQASRTQNKESRWTAKSIQSFFFITHASCLVYKEKITQDRRRCICRDRKPTCSARETTPETSLIDSIYKLVYFIKCSKISCIFLKYLHDLIKVLSGFRTPPCPVPRAGWIN